MKFVLNAAQAKKIDELSIEKTGILSLVLMEKASLSVAKQVKKYIKKNNIKNCNIISVCGNGNNGADGVCVARILKEWGYSCEIAVFKNEGTKEYNYQLDLAKKLNVNIKDVSKVKFDEYNIIVDAIFGIGLSRNIENVYATIIDKINAAKAYVIAVDIASGVNASDAKIMNVAVKANTTVTFGMAKIGHLLYPGAEYTGKLKVKDIGFSSKAIDKVNNKAVYFCNKDLKLLPDRKKNSHKGTFGKVLVIAGSKDMGGAAILSGLSAYSSGAGLVRVYTHINNKEALLETVPEAIIDSYTNEVSKEEIDKRITEALDWATTVILGPGLSTENIAKELVICTLKKIQKPLIIDADALNIIAKDSKAKQCFKEAAKRNEAIIITPHIAEMARLIHKSNAYVTENIISVCTSFAANNNVTCICKDARTIVSDKNKKIYINVSGNSGMSTGGSGDVLTGVIAALVAQKIDCYEAACLGVYLHGKGGDYAAKKIGEDGMKASDIIIGIKKNLKKIRKVK